MRSAKLEKAEFSPPGLVVNLNCLCTAGERDKLTFRKEKL